MSASRDAGGLGIDDVAVLDRLEPLMVRV